MVGTSEELRAEIERLTRENEELRAGRKTPISALMSIEGLDTLAMRIGSDERILHINTAFVRHFGVARKEDVIGQKMDILRRFLNAELLLAIARPEEGESLVRMANDKQGRVFEVKTTLHDGMLDVVMLDRTEEQQFRGLVQRYVLKDFDSLSEEDLRTFRFPERRFMTVSFTDLRGFTALTETLRPEEVRGMINAYFEEVIRVVEANDATVAQLVGDEVMAFYGAPRYFKDHALRAIKTACEQVEKVEELIERYAKEGKAMCPCGVGINTGDMVLGNMGGAGKQAYTVLGPAVNLGSRLCDAAKGGQILLTEVVLKAALDALPTGWEMVEGQSLMGADEDLLSIGGKIEDVHELPDHLRGKVISIGPGIKTQKKPPEFSFHYLYVLKPKGVTHELPVISVQRGTRRSSRILNDETIRAEQTEIMVGKYRLLEMLGQGGMGKVWLARDQFGNRVAIKMLTAGQSASQHQLERFKREATVMAKLSHHNICRIYEIGEAEGVTFIAMEFVDGVSLADIIRRGSRSTSGSSHHSSAASALTDLVASIKQERASGSSIVENEAPDSGSTVLTALPMQQVMALMTKTCEAVQFAHEHGVLHRDLKPENIMLRSDGDPVVMDFGLAKFELEKREAGDVAGMSLSMEGQIVGTIEYMAPEQAQSSKHVNERADVYSLGAILYQLLTGRKHFVSSGNILQDAHHLQDHEAPPLRQFSKLIDSDLETIALKALRPEPTERYASAKQLLEDLNRYQSGDPISARAPTLAYRMAKRIRKNRVAYGLSALILLFVIVFGGWSYIEWRKQWGDWTEVFGADFSKPAAAGSWLTEQLEFENKDATATVTPWPVNGGSLKMRKHEWCWLKNVRIRNDVKVVVKMRFTGKLDAFQICLNAQKDLRKWDDNPPGYSCRFGIWNGAMDLISQDAIARGNDFNSLVVSAAPAVMLPNGAGTKDFTLTFQRQGERMSLAVDGKEVHHEFYLTPLINPHGATASPEDQYELIGLRTWSASAEVQSIHAYRFKLAEKASPVVTGDALTEAGYLDDAIERYIDVAKDYENASASIPVQALSKAYLLSVSMGHADRRQECLNDLANLHSSGWRRLLPGNTDAEYLQTVREVETVMLWKDGKKSEALQRMSDVFAANPDTRIALDCLQAERHLPHPELSGELMERIAQTRKLAGLNVSSFGLKDLEAVAGLKSLTCLDCRSNELSSLDPLRGMTALRALYCQTNEIVSLQPLHGLPLFELYCDTNQIKSLEPLRGMALETLYCRRNQIEDLSPLSRMPLYALNCSTNQVGTLAPLSGLKTLGELYCANNHIKALDPLAGLGSLGYLDCANNEIVSLEPLKGLKLYSLNCTGNKLTTLEPFVTGAIPPEAFYFECKTLPDAEIQRAITAWSAKDLTDNVRYAQLVLAMRHEDPAQMKALAAEFGGHHYLYIPQPLTAAEADKFCKKVGAHLATITTEKEDDFLRTITPPDVICLIGLNVTAGKAHWVTGEDFDKNYKPEPADILLKDGVVTWKNGDWKTVTARQDRALPLIIEWD